jgi:hypothetical protein
VVPAASTPALVTISVGSDATGAEVEVMVAIVKSCARRRRRQG